MENNPLIYTDPFGQWHWHDDEHRYIDPDKDDDEYSLARFLYNQTGRSYYGSELKRVYDSDEGAVGTLTIDINGGAHSFTNTAGATDASWALVPLPKAAKLIWAAIQIFRALASESNSTPKPAQGARSIKDLFRGGRTPTATEIAEYAKSRGWTMRQTPGGPPKFIDENGVVRITIKKGSSRAPGSDFPHVEIRDANGTRVDPEGNPVTRTSPDNHTPINWAW